MHHRALSAVALATLSLITAPAGAVPVTPVRDFERIVAPEGSLEAGYLAGGSDVNGDGVPDILFGTLNGQLGRVNIVSGSNGLIATLDGRATTAVLGYAVAFVGDLDGDGVSDFAASSLGDQIAYVYSGATRARLLPRARTFFGGGIAPLGDIDGDAVPDFLVGRGGFDHEFFIAGAYSGRTGAALYTVTDSSRFNGPTPAASAIGDIDGDGITEVLVGGGGNTWLLSGKTGAVLRDWGYGGWIHGVGDITGDGVPDYAVTDSIYSGASGQPFLRTLGPVIGLGQLDGAGGRDFAMITPIGLLLFDYQANTTLGTLTDPTLHTLSSFVMEPVGDLDGDGTTDFAIAGSRTPRAELHVFRNLRGTPHAATIDVLPKACPNVLPGNGGGPFEVAILGDVTGDVSRIDAASVRLAGIAPSSSSVRRRDIGTPGVTSDCACPNSAPDGIDDIVLRFDAGALRKALDPVAPGTVTSLPLSVLASDGVAWSGSDCVTSSGGRGNNAAIADVPALRTVGSNVIATGKGVDLAYPAPSEPGAMRVTIFDLAGRRVAELPEGVSADGVRTTHWDGRDASGSAVRRGVYFAQARGADVKGRSVMIVVR